MNADQEQPRIPYARSGKPFTPNSARAGASGIGGGTGIVAIAQAIGPETAIGAVLIYLAPAIAVVVGAVTYYTELRVSRYLERREVASARRTLELQLDNPRLSFEYKNRILKMLEELEETVATTELSRVRSFSLRVGMRSGPTGDDQQSV